MKLTSLLCLLAITLTTGLWAQDTTYSLRPGDTLAITVWDHPEFSMPEVQIRPDGKFMHPFAGEIVAAGKSPVQLSGEIRKALLTEIRKPVVSVSVVRYREDWLFVAGAVVRPGTISSRQALTIQQAVAAAGGPTTKANLDRALVIARNGARQDINLGAELKGAQDTGKIMLEAGSTLILYELEPRNVAVIGAVGQAGIYPIPPQGLRFSDALALAGGLLDEADAEAVRFSRAGQPTITVNARRLLDDAADPSNVALANGDALLVPSQSPRTFAVLGQVITPGVKPLLKGRATRLSDALAAAGGLSSSADGSSATLMRADGSSLRLDLRSLLQGSAGQQDLDIASNDTLFVPELPGVVVLGTVVRPGRYALAQGSRISDALAAAGDVVGDPTRALASLIHADGATQEIILRQVLIARDPATNLRLADRDTLIVRSLDQGQVAILGAVERAGRFPLTQARRVADLLSLGAPTQDAGSLATLLRDNGQNVEINLDTVLQDPQAATNFELADGDTLVVSNAQRNVVVLGAVKTPGRFPLRKGDRFSDAVAAAGDMTPQADWQAARILRAGGAVIGVSPLQALSSRTDALNPTLEEGDSVIIDKAEIQVAVLGEVLKPAVYPLRRPARFSDAMAQAGGLRPDSRVRTATLVRPGANPAQIDLARALDAGEEAQNVLLQDGDMIVLQAGPPREVAVLGHVTKPSKIIMDAGDRVSDALAKAGGLADGADDERATILRADGSVADVDLAGLLSRQDSAANLALRPGDTLIINPAAQGYAGVMGAVKTSGLVEVKRGWRLSNLLAAAGGPVEGAELAAASLRRADGTQVPINLAAVLESADSAVNLPVAVGDTLYVPARAASNVAILGPVKNPGRYPAGRNTRFSGLLALAGGVSTPYSGILEATLVHADGASLPISVQEALNQPGTAADPLLTDGDTVILREPEPVTILGAVRTPGAYPVPAGTRLSGLLGIAQGALPTADATRATLIRRDGQRLEINLDTLLSGADPAADLVARPGDILSVPDGDRFVSVLGAVKLPGRVTIRPQARVTDAIAQAGGMPEDARQPRATILRGADRIPVDLALVLRGKDTAANLLLDNGDTLLVERMQPASISVMGEVKAPGNFTFGAPSRLSDAIAKAGGFSENAEPTQVKLVRQGTQTAVDLAPYLRGESLPDDPALTDGDLVVVPESTHRVMILGQAKTPGSYVFRPGDRLLNVLAAHGWVTDKGAAHRAYLVRQTAPDTAAYAEVSLIRAAKYGDNKGNPELRNGDIIFIPPLSTRNASFYIQSLLPISQFINILTF
jgi:polysaccharide export outer membrane protein